MVLVKKGVVVLKKGGGAEKCMLMHWNGGGGGGGGGDAVPSLSEVFISKKNDEKNKLPCGQETSMYDVSWAFMFVGANYHGDRVLGVVIVVAVAGDGGGMRNSWPCVT